MSSENAVTDTVNLFLRGVSTTTSYNPGDSILETARRASLYPPFRCQKGNCGSCKALIESGRVKMKRNNKLTFLDIKDGWVLTCQAIPTSQTISINYDARRLLPGLRFLLRVMGTNQIGQRKLTSKNDDQARD